MKITKVRKWQPDLASDEISGRYLLDSSYTLVIPWLSLCYPCFRPFCGFFGAFLRPGVGAGSEPTRRKVAKYQNKGLTRVKAGYSQSYSQSFYGRIVYL